MYTSICQPTISAIMAIIALFAIPGQSHPTRPKDSMSSLNAELDKNEISHPYFIKFTSDSMGDKTVKAGESIELRCEASGSPSPVFYWMFNGKKIQGNSDMNIYEKLHNIGKPTVQNGVTVSRLVIPCASSENRGKYKCVATNGHSRIEKVAKISVSGEGSCPARDGEAPKIVEWSDARFENEENAVQLMCRTNSPATIAWYNDERKLLNNEANFEVFANGDLMIKKANWEHMGIYTCVASNEFGEDRANVFFYPTSVDDSGTLADLK